MAKSASFFRDPVAFGALDQHVFRPLAKSKEAGASMRIWVPACSTGEEVYSVAISLLEALDDDASRFTIKIFGSDASDEAVKVARAGFYPDAALAELSPARLSRFFVRIRGGYRVDKRVRDLCVFARHDLTQDPPFTRLDLICCRDVLIPPDADLQRGILAMLQYSLQRIDTPGYLFLGRSEASAGFRELFAPLDKDHRLFTPIGKGLRTSHPIASARQAEATLARTALDRSPPVREAQRQADQLLLARFAPAGVLVNDRLEVVQFRGRTGAFLESPPGQPDTNLLRMAREGLAARLRDALDRAKAQSAAVRLENLQVEASDGIRSVDLEVVPLPNFSGAAERFFIVLFHERDAADDARAARAQTSTTSAIAGESSKSEADEIWRLKEELAATRDYLRSIAADHRSTTDELAAANDELSAANEELQSINEELQSAQEELRSSNEEINTVNEELRGRNVDLDQVASDLINVLASVEIPVIIVDLNLNVRRFTPTVRAIAGLIPEDVGRPIDDLRLKVQVDDLTGKVREVLADRAPKEWQIEGPEGRWYRLHIRPYLTTDNRLDGAVLAFVDVDTLKRALKDAEVARDYARSVLGTVTAARLEAERANVAKDLFLATLSHELRTPLGTVMMEAQILARLAGDDARLQRVSGSIERSARTQARLIDDLLDVSRIASGKLLLDLRPLDLKEAVQSAVATALPAAQAKSLVLQQAIAGDFVATVHGDAVRLQQVVSNLLVNAIKFTSAGGRIRVRLDRAGEQAQISVTDTGIGIRAELLPHLFGTFVQADSSVTRAHGGLGLGLAIVRHLVEAHGGHAHAESPGEGRGATFRVTLPLAVGPRARVDGGHGAIPGDISGVRVLLVDDSADTRSSFSALLEQLGAEVCAAPSSSTGLAVLDGFRPDVILSDIAMPGEDGYSFIQQVRRLPPDHGGRVPAAALTALASEDDQRRSKDAGFQMHLAKPLDAVRLAAAVRALAAMAPSP